MIYNLTALEEGVRKEIANNNSWRYVFDWEKDLPTDIVHLNMPPLHKKELEGAPYYFGYKFNTTLRREIINELRNNLKSTHDDWDRVDPDDFQSFIERPVWELNQIKPISDFNVICYNRPKKWSLLSHIVSNLREYMNVEVLLSIEMIKNISKNVSFDMEKFKEDFSNRYSSYFYQDDLLRVETYLKRFSKDSPSLFAMKYISPRLRKYFYNFLIWDNEEQKKLYRYLQNKDVLIVDDFFTSGTTIKEIFKILKNINPNNNLYVYTLFGS